MRLAYFVHPYDVHRVPALHSRDREATPPEGVAETASLLMEKTATQQVYRLPIDPNLFKYVLCSIHPHPLPLFTNGGVTLGWLHCMKYLPCAHTCPAEG